MASKFLAGLLVFVLSFILCKPAHADSGTIGGVGTGTIVGVIVGVVAAVAVVAIVAIHYSRKRTITGCVKPTPNGMTVSDEKNDRTYTLSGDIAGIKPGERLTLQGKKIKPSTGNSLGWEVSKMQTDLGVCQL
ncbi:MAG TPA: hypothetical protein VK828_22260 [Terriglobales bacterium]|jgi:hypothetical protein|nr:hypothetical protein [Terriglobales bacterium]